MSEFTYWVNGDFVPASRAMVPLTSRGYRMGDGVFDTERTFNGKIFKLDEHLARLEKSLRFARIELGMTLAELGRISQETLEKNLPLLETHGDFWVTQTISRGAGKNPLQAGPSFVSVIVEPLPLARFAPYCEEGIHVVAPSVRSTALSGLDPKLKATSRLNMVLADLESKQTDPEALTLLLDEQGNIAEVLYGNVFVVRNGKIRTPGGRGILEGITRGTTMELARGAGFEVTEAELQPYDLYTADEAFVTTTSYCVLPVRMLNGSPVGNEVPGAVTRRVLEAWNDLAGLDIAGQMRACAARAEAPPQAVKAAAR